MGKNVHGNNRIYPASLIMTGCVLAKPRGFENLITRTTTIRQRTTFIATRDHFQVKNSNK